MPTEAVEGDTLGRSSKEVNAKTEERVGTPPSRSAPLRPQALVDSLGGQSGADALPLKTGAELQAGSEPVSGVCSVCWGSQAATPGLPKQHSQGCVSNTFSCSLFSASLFLLLYFHFTLHNVSYPRV